MSGADWVALVAGIVLGGAIGAPLGFYFGRRNVAAATVMASQAAQVKAELTASSERDQINAAAAALQAKIPAEAPEQAVNDLENLP